MNNGSYRYNIWKLIEPQNRHEYCGDWEKNISAPFGNDYDYYNRLLLLLGLSKSRRIRAEIVTGMVEIQNEYIILVGQCKKVIPMEEILIYGRIILKLF